MVLTDFFEFDEIYTKAEHFFVNRDQLNELRDRNELLLPIKTNLIMVDQTIINNSSPLMSLFFTIVLKTFRNERFVLYFKDGQYSITLERAFRLWYYIIYKWWGKDVEFTAPALLIAYILDTPFDYTLEDIDLITAEYDALGYTDVDSGEQVRLFYKEKIEEIFQQFQVTPIEYTQEQWTDTFKDNLGKDLIGYVDNRMTNIETGSDVTRETIAILDEVYNSIITWSVTSGDQDVKDYLHYFTDLLPLLMVQPEKTATFRILNFLKPFHVELTGQGRQILEVNDKFNAIYADERWNFVIKMPDVTLHNMSHPFMQKVSLPLYSQKEIIQDAYFIINAYMKMVHDIINEFKMTTIKRNATLAAFSYNEIKSLMNKLITNLHIFDEIPVFRSLGYESEFNYEDFFHPITKIPKTIIEDIFDIYKFEMTPNRAYDNVHVFEEMSVFRERFWREFNIDDYFSKGDIIFIDNTIEEIVNNYNHIVEKDPNYDNVIIDLIIWFRERFWIELNIDDSTYIFNNMYIENTIEEVMDIYNYVILKDPNKDEIEINVTIPVFRRRRKYNFDIDYIYYFNLEITKSTLENIFNNYNYIIKKDPNYDNLNIDVYAWWRQRFFKLFEIDYIYRFDISTKEDLLIEAVNNYNYVIQKDADYDDMPISDTYIFVERFFDTVYNIQLYTFSTNILQSIIFFMLDFCDFVVRKLPEYDNLHLYDDCPTHRAGYYDNFDINTNTWDYKYFPVVAYEDFYDIKEDYYFNITDKDMEESMEISHDFNTIKL